MTDRMTYRRDQVHPVVLLGLSGQLLDLRRFRMLVADLAELLEHTETEAVYATTWEQQDAVFSRARSLGVACFRLRGGDYDIVSDRLRGREGVSA